MRKIKIGIIDDHQAVARGLRSELEASGNFEVLFIVSEKEKLIEALSGQMPDILIMDVVMPGTVSTEAFKQVLATFPDLKILAYTALNSPMIIELLLNAGVKGYVNKNQDLSDVGEALSFIYDGEIYLPGEYEFIRKKINKQDFKEGLSKREIEILVLIAQEKTTAEISKALFISVSTVETHRRNLFQKLNVTNLAGLIRSGIQLGYIQ